MKALALFLMAGPAAAAGIECELTYGCIDDACHAGEITLKIEERDGQAGVISSEGFYPVEKRQDDASGWVTYITPVDNGEVYFLSVLPDGTAMASGHAAGYFADPAARTVYGATGTCKAME